MITVTRKDRSIPKGGRKGKKRNAHFMDVAMQAYVRHLALTLLRDIEDNLDTNGVTLPQALEQAGNFMERVPYHAPWQKVWQELLDADGPYTRENVFTAIEAAMGQAAMEEQEMRKNAGDPLIEDTSDYTLFIGSAMGRLLEEASGEVEEF